MKIYVIVKDLGAGITFYDKVVSLEPETRYDEFVYKNKENAIRKLEEIVNLSTPWEVKPIDACRMIKAYDISRYKNICKGYKFWMRVGIMEIEVADQETEN